MQVYNITCILTYVLLFKEDSIYPNSWCQIQHRNNTLFQYKQISHSIATPGVVSN